MMQKWKNRVPAILCLGMVICAGCDDQLLDDIVDHIGDSPDPGESDTEETLVVGPAGAKCSETEDVGDVDAVEMSEDYEILVKVEGNTVTVVNTNAFFNCCLDAWMEARVESGRIVVVEKEASDKTGACWCICGRELTVDIPNLDAGDYSVLVYHESMIEDNLLFEQQITVADL